MNKNLYVGDRDVDLFHWAEAYAHETRRGVNAVVFMGLELLRAQVEGDQVKSDQADDDQS
ncbi:hypothetical protein [Phytoactinopolyspora endophytica]|uniref:hypothetical protein n=1 Tax=Phytoactinopolyspora endophytica TaxID=1642495 RepID=UPI00101CE4EA|nr:hypothetical protein [Phytoactinopolyspora endophytica]